MAVIEDLSEEEGYLYAILQDHSGLDHAEFLWVEEENADGCWRAWPFQYTWWRCADKYQVDLAARSVGKSLSIQARAFAFPFIHPGQEFVATAPEGTHLDAVTDKVETRFLNTRLGMHMLRGGRQSFRHRPFHANFVNGSRIMGRIPHRDGANIKGTHPIWLELDEGQDYPDAGWTEITETLKRGSEGAVWRVHGVTKGIRDEFYRITQPSSSWTVHKIVAMMRPTWSDEERAFAIEQYHGRDSDDYRRNILGEHGDASSPLFVLHRLMNCVDDEKESSYNSDEYQFFDLLDSYLREFGMTPIEALTFGPRKYKRYWCGMDVGYINHPSEILVFAEENPSIPERKHLTAAKKACPEEGHSRLKLICRISMHRISTRDQYEVIRHVIRHFQPDAFAMDKTGNGLPLFQLMETDDDESVAEVVKGYNFSGKILVDFDPTIDVDEFASQDEMAKEAGIQRNVPDYAIDVLRRLIDDKRLWLPWDDDLLNEFQGQTYKVTKTTMDQYARREYSAGKFHALDAAKMMALGWKQWSIEQFMKVDRQAPVLDVFVEF